VTNEAKQSKREQTGANRSKRGQKEANGQKKRSKEKQILGGSTPNAALPLSPLLLL